MRRHLSIAAAALLVGTALATAQGPKGPGDPEGATPGGAPSAPQDGQGKGKAQSKEPAQGQRDGATGTQPKQQQGQQAPQPGQQPKQQQGQQTPRDTQAGGDDKGKAADKGKPAEGKQTGGVTLNVEQRTTIRNTVIKSGNAPRVTNVNFSVNVGTVVPRTVTMVAVPPTLIEIQPAWRGYVYFIVGERIVIVEPDSYRIVAILVV